MKSNKLIYKQRYQANPDDAVVLVEYMMFIDEETNEKFILLKVKNQSSDKVLKIELDLDQRNNLGESIVQEKYVFDQLDLCPNQETVLLKKIKVKEVCDSVSCQLKPLEVEVINHETELTTTQIKEEKALVIKDELPYQVRVLNHNKIGFPYLISLEFALIFIMSVLIVFNLIN